MRSWVLASEVVTFQNKRWILKLAHTSAHNSAFKTCPSQKTQPCLWCTSKMQSHQPRSAPTTNKSSLSASLAISTSSLVISWARSFPSFCSQTAYLSKSVYPTRSKSTSSTASKPSTSCSSSNSPTHNSNRYNWNQAKSLSRPTILSQASKMTSLVARGSWRRTSNSSRK